MLAALNRPVTGVAFRLVAGAYATFSLLDWMTTAQALPRGGREGNPIAASLYSEYGAAGLLLFKIVVVSVIIGVLALIPRRIMSQRVAVWVGTIFAVLTAITVIGNLHALASLNGGPWDYHRAPGVTFL